MTKFVILCDLDDIVVSLLDKWLDDYNWDHTDTLGVKDIHNFDMSKVVKKSCGKKIYNYINEDGYFTKLKPIDGAIESLKILHREGHEIIIVSSPSASPESYRDKIIWCDKYLPFISRENIILTKKKYLIKGDILIDDSTENIRLYRKHWPLSTILSIAYPHNKDAEQHADMIFNDWSTPRKAWKNMIKFIQDKQI
jgi:5'(3')-deoxyribonucleotidase